MYNILRVLYIILYINSAVYVYTPRIIIPARGEGGGIGWACMAQCGGLMAVRGTTGALLAATGGSATTQTGNIETFAFLY